MANFCHPKKKKLKLPIIEAKITKIIYYLYIYVPCRLKRLPYKEKIPMIFILFYCMGRVCRPSGRGVEATSFLVSSPTRDLCEICSLFDLLLPIYTHALLSSTTRALFRLKHKTCFCLPSSSSTRVLFHYISPQSSHRVGLGISVLIFCWKLVQSV